MAVYSSCPRRDSGWMCTICRKRDPLISGGFVAHEGDGGLHADHKDCLFEWNRFSSRCPTCRIETDISQLNPSISILAERIIRTFSLKIYQKARQPLNQMKLSLICLSIARMRKSHFFASVGFSILAYAFHRTIKYGSRHIAIARQIEQLGRPLDRAQVELLIASVPRYQELFEQKGVLKLYEMVQKDLRSDKIIHFYRNAAAMAGLYQALKSASYFSVLF